MKFKYLLRLVLVAVVLYVSVVYLDGIVLTDTSYGIIPSFILLFAVFAVIEVILYPIMKMLILPLRLITFGLASAVLSVNLVYVVAWLHPFFTVSSFWHALLVGIGLGIVRFLTR